MRFSLLALVRLISLLVVAATIGAIGLARLLPEADGGHRAAFTPRFVGVNGSAFIPPGPRNFLLDTATGRLEPVAHADASEAIDFASVAPWCGESGELETVGQLLTRSGRNASSLRVPSGLARFDLKTGKVLDTVALDPVIVGAPCWLPGAERRVVFPAAGDLCLQAFPADGSDAEAPRKVRWAAAFPDVETVAFNDVSCPNLPELGGRLLVSLRLVRGKAERHVFGPSEVWWVKLDPVHAAITAAGRVTEPAGSLKDERLPVMAKGADGGVVLAYLMRNEGRPGHGLRLAPVRLAPGAGGPVARAEETYAGPGDCLVNAPAFSPDGRSLFWLDRAQAPSEGARRIDVAEGLRRAPGLVLGQRPRAGQGLAVR